MYDAQKDMDDNPTFDEMREAIVKYNPATVLDVGCGYGRELVALSPHFNIEGCDVSDDLLERVPPRLKSFKLDIVEPGAFSRSFDVSFTRAVMMYFPDPKTMKKAMQTLDRITTRKVIIWEWRHVCALMQEVYPSRKFEYHTMSLKQE
jgi:trans-aconitate methyltransferase